MKTRVHTSTVVQNTCGLALLSVFREDDGDWWGSEATSKIKPMAGTGFVLAGFTTERPAYEAAYEELKKRWKIVYQSPVRVNTRTNRKFFFCIYDSRTKP